MAYIRLTFFSEAINGTTDASVFFPYLHNLDQKSRSGRRNRAVGDPGLPDFSKVKGADANDVLKLMQETWVDDVPYDKAKRYQVLYLISGGGGDFLDWPIETMIESKCLKSQLIVVMPTIRDFNGIQKGADYMKYIAEELPEFIRFLFPVSKARQDTFICGFSYGGYYTYMVGMNYADQYGCVASFGAPVDVVMDIRRLHSGHSTAAKAEEVEGTNRDVLWLAKKRKEQGLYIPRLFQSVGTEDFTWDFNVSARDHFRSLGLDHTWTQGPGTHGYKYCSEHFQDLLDFLPLKKKAFVPEEEK
jgi:putative tributyrin esterase